MLKKIYAWGYREFRESGENKIWREKKMCKTCIMSKKHVCLFCKMWNTISFSLACKLNSSFEYKEQTICASLQLELGLLTEDLPL